MLRLLALVVALTLTGCSFGENAGKADKAVTQFHAKLNDAKFGDITAGSAAEMKSEPKFGQLLEVVRHKLGRVMSSKQVGWNENVNTSGHFVTLNYETKFEKGNGTENFVYRFDGDRMVLAGWHINSDALVLN